MSSDTMFRHASARPQPTMAFQPASRRNSMRVASTSASYDLGLFADMRHRTAIDALPDVRLDDLGDDDVMLLDERTPTEPLVSALSSQMNTTRVKSPANLSNIFARKDSLLDPRPIIDSHAAAEHDGAKNTLIQGIVAKHGQWSMISPAEATRVGEYIRPIQPDGLEAYLDLELTNLRALRDSEPSGARSRPNSPTSTRANLSPLEYLVLDSYYLTQENRGLRTQLKDLEKTNRHLSTERTCLELRGEHVAKELARVERQLRHLYAHLALEAHEPMDRVERLCGALAREKAHLARIKELDNKLEAAERRRKVCVERLGIEHLDRLQFERDVTKSLKILNDRLALEQGARVHCEKQLFDIKQAGEEYSENDTVESASPTPRAALLNPSTDLRREARLAIPNMRQARGVYSDDDTLESATPTPRATLLNPFANLRRQVHLTIPATIAPALTPTPETPPNSPTPTKPLDPFCATPLHPGCGLCNAGGACIAKLIANSFSAEEELRCFGDIEGDDDNNDDCVPVGAEPQCFESSAANQASDVAAASEDNQSLSSPPYVGHGEHASSATSVKAECEPADCEQMEQSIVRATVARIPMSSTANTTPVLATVSAAYAAAVVPAPIAIAGRDSTSKYAAQSLFANTLMEGSIKMPILSTDFRPERQTLFLTPVAPIDEMAQSASVSKAQPATAVFTYAMLRARFGEIRAKMREPLANLEKEKLAIQMQESQPAQATTISSQSILKVDCQSTCERQQSMHPQQHSCATTPMPVVMANVKSADAIPICRVPLTVGASTVTHRLAKLLAKTHVLESASKGLFHERRQLDAPAAPSTPAHVPPSLANPDVAQDQPAQAAEVVFATGPHRLPTITEPSACLTSTFSSTTQVPCPTISQPLDTAQVSTDLAKAMFGIVSGVAQMARRIHNETARHVEETGVN